MIDQHLVLEFFDALLAGVSEETVDLIRDQLDEEWYRLGEVECALFRDLFRDLDFLYVKSVRFEKDLALLRAQAWRELGYDLVAERFERHASTLDREIP